MNNPDLPDMLADPAGSGVYFLAQAGSEALIAGADRLAFFVARVNLEDCRDHEAALAQIAEALRFPAWYGANWDALSDCINDLSWLPAEGFVVLLEHPSHWRAAEPAAFQALLELLEEAAQRWRESGVAFWALVPATEVGIDGDPG